MFVYECVCVCVCVCVCACVCACVCVWGDNRACLSDCVSLIIAVISYRAQAAAEWFEKKGKSHFLPLFELHHTLWHDHLLTIRHDRLIWIYVRETHKLRQTDSPTAAQHTQKDKHATWSVHPGDVLELKFTGVSSTYLSLHLFFQLKKSLLLCKLFLTESFNSRLLAWLVTLHEWYARIDYLQVESSG